MSEPQLERSVLEAKEREELYAIADALGTKPGSRAKKADLIAQILRATGVETDVAEPVEKPRRTRARKAAAPVASEASDAPDAAEVPEATEAAGEPGGRDTVDGPRAGDDVAAPGEAGEEERAEQLALDATPPSRRERSGLGRGAAAAARAGLEGSDDSAELADAAPEAANGSAGPASAVNGSAPGEAADDASADEVTPGRGWSAGAGSTPAPAADSGRYQAPDDHGSNGAADPTLPRAGDSGGSTSPAIRPGRNQSDGRGRQGADGQGNQQSGNQQFGNQQSGNQPGPQQHGGQQPGNQQGAPNQQGGQQGSQGNQQGNANQQGSQQAGAQTSADRQRFDADPGNRRNRRRRGRDRTGTERTEHDLQGAAPEQTQQQFSGEPIAVTGLLDLRDEGYGFLRTKGFLAGPDDVYVSISQVRRFALRKGD